MDKVIIGTSRITHVNKYKCCLCGKERDNHYHAKHKFFLANENNKCKKCNKWFYQHDHIKNPCFDPKERLM